MKLRKKYPLISMFYLALILWSTSSWSRDVLLWGGSHSFYESDSCADQLDLFEKDFSKNPDQYPNLIFASETPSPQNNPRALQIEDNFIHTYASIYTVTDSYASTMYNAFHGGELQDGNFYADLVRVSYRVLVTSSESKLIGTIADEIIKRDGNEPYIKRILGDIQKAKDIESKVDITNKKYEAGIDNLFLTNGFRINDPEFTSKVDLLIESYVELSKRISTVFFDRYIAKNKKKYDLTIHNEDSQYNGKNVFSVVSPGFLFQPNKNVSERGIIYLGNSDASNILMLDWRNEFIFQNIQLLMKKYPNSDLLVFMGSDHIKGVIQYLLKSKDLKDSEKNNMYAVSRETNPDILCDYKSIVNTLHSKDGSLNLLNWKGTYLQANGSPNYKYDLWSNDGTKIYHEHSYMGQTDNQTISELIKDWLKTNQKKKGIYFLELKSDFNEKIKTFRILFI